MSGTSCPDCGGEHEPSAGACRESSLVGRTLGGSLRVIERLAETNAGTLYHADYLTTQLDVALLILRPGPQDPESPSSSITRAWLRDQFHQAILLNHPNIFAVHTMAETPEGLVYVVGEYLEGDLLSDILAARGPPTLEEAVDLFLQAAAALQAAHASGIVHGNLSPHAIFVTRAADGRPLAKVLCFGRAATLWQHGPERPAETAMGAEYASPERLAGHPPDERSDVFSLGAVLHQLLSGAPPGSGLEGRSIPEVVRTVVAEALAPAPAERFQTISEFAAALERAAAIHRGAERATAYGGAGLDQLGDEAPQPFVILVPGSADHHRRALVLGVAGAALVLVAAGLWLVWSSQRSKPNAARRPLETGTRAPPTAARPESARAQATGLDTARVVLDTRAPDSIAQRMAIQSARRAAPPPQERHLGAPVRPPPQRVDSEPAELKLAEPEPPAPLTVTGRVEPLPMREQPSVPELTNEAVDREVLEAQARAAAGRAVATYARALESLDMAALQRAYPGLTEREQAVWEEFFKVARNLAVRLGIERFSMSDSVVHVDVRGTYQYWNRSLNRIERPQVNFSATLTRSAEGWRLATIQ